MDIITVLAGFVLILVSIILAIIRFKTKEDNEVGWGRFKVKIGIIGLFLIAGVLLVIAPRLENLIQQYFSPKINTNIKSDNSSGMNINIVNSTIYAMINNKQSSTIESFKNAESNTGPLFEVNGELAKTDITKLVEQVNKDGTVLVKSISNTSSASITSTWISIPKDKIPTFKLVNFSLNEKK